MARSVSVNQQAAFDAKVARPILLIEVDWTTGLQKYVTAGADVQWSGGVQTPPNTTWQATGMLVDVSPIEESNEVVATGIKITLSGAPFNSALISYTLQEQIQGRRVSIWFATLTDAGGFSDTPMLVYQGRADVLSIMEGETAAIVLTVENKMAGLLGACVRRYTDADQVKYYPGDRIFQYVAQMKEKLIVFPSAQAQHK